MQFSKPGLTCVAAVIMLATAACTSHAVAPPRAAAAPFIGTVQARAAVTHSEEVTIPPPAAVTRNEGVTIPSAAVAAMVVGGAAFLAGTFSFPTTQEADSPGAFTWTAMGVAAAGFATAGVLIVATPPERTAEIHVAVAPAAATVGGHF